MTGRQIKQRLRVQNVALVRAAIKNLLAELETYRAMPAGKDALITISLAQQHLADAASHIEFMRDIEKDYPDA